MGTHKQIRKNVKFVECYIRRNNLDVNIVKGHLSDRGQLRERYLGNMMARMRAQICEGQERIGEYTNCWLCKQGLLFKRYNEPGCQAYVNVHVQAHEYIIPLQTNF